MKKIFLLFVIIFFSAKSFVFAGDIASFFEKGSMFPVKNETVPVENKDDSATKKIKESSNNTLRIGLLLPLSGPSQRLGEILRNSALMAQFEVADDNFIMQFYDTQGRAEIAELAFKKASDEGVDLIVGPLFAGEVKAISPMANSDGLKVISFTSDASVLGDGIYSVALLVPQQIERIVAYACANGSKKFALVTRDDEYGKAVADALSIAVASCEGAEISGEGYYDTDSSLENNNMSEVVKLIIGKKAFLVDNERAKQKSRTFKNVRRISEGGKAINLSVEDFEISSKDVEPDFDTILVADESSRLRSVAALLSYYDINSNNVKIIGTSLWDDASISRESALINGLYPALQSSGFNDFSSRYKNLYGTTPPRIASQAYDAIALVATLIKNYNRLSITDEMLTNSAGFLGVDGIFRLHSNGFCERALAIYKIGKKRNSIVSPAKETFDSENIFKNY